MAKLEELTRGASVTGILPDCAVQIVDVNWIGNVAVEATYKDLQLPMILRIASQAQFPPAPRK